METSSNENHTRRRLLDAALHLFGHKGFDGTSTRELAARAQTNVASITYHFGGKSELRQECARTVAERLSLTLDTSDINSAAMTPDAALAQIERLVDGLVHLIVATPQAHDMVAFLLRELTAPGEVTETLYAELVDSRHKALCDLWAKATGRGKTDEEIKLAVFATLGQILYFRIAEPFVVPRMSWEGLGPDETRMIANTVRSNLRCSIERLKT